MVRYLTVEELIAINARQDGGVGVHDLGGVEANAARPQSGFGDQDTFPDLYSKAAAYLHGIASTQYFHDGNKRTAWLAADIFLRMNGANLPRVPDIEAEIFVQAIAQSVLDTDEEPTRTLDSAAEWYRAKCGVLTPMDGSGQWGPTPAEAARRESDHPYATEAITRWVIAFRYALQRAVKTYANQDEVTVNPYMLGRELLNVTVARDGVVITGHPSREEIAITVGAAPMTIERLVANLSPNATFQEGLQDVDYTVFSIHRAFEAFRTYPNVDVIIERTGWNWMVIAPGGDDGYSWKIDTERLDAFAKAIVDPMPENGRGRASSGPILI